ncbi:MAG: GNAT family N-acetyltransferase [Devosia sp.]|nr:GNAT family N-acetyltransferase [Devosia sp.]
MVATLQISLSPGLSRFGTWRAMLENVFVDPDRHGSGIGTELVQ